MAFQAPTAAPRQIPRTTSTQPETSAPTFQRPVEQSQEWVLFSPSQYGSSTNQTFTTQTAGLSRQSDLGSLNTAGRSGRLESEVLDDNAAEDAELDTLDDGLHAFQEPLYTTSTHQTEGAVLPTHDGLGTFPASSPPVLEQLWQHEQYNPKRKHDGQHRRTSSLQRRLDTIEEIELQANEDKRIRIEKWRLEQSQAMLEEVERETRRKLKRTSVQSSAAENILSTTPKQSDYLDTEPEDEESVPFWRKITRKFIRDIIGIDEPLLSVILGESLPEEALEPPRSTTPRPDDLEPDPAREAGPDSWRDKLLQRIARELGVFVHQLTPHPGAFASYNPPNQTHDYAGMPVSISKRAESSMQSPAVTRTASSLTPNFPPTVHNPAHAETWGFEEEPASGSSASLVLQRERQYWERELDVRMVFRYLRDRFGSRAAENGPALNQRTTEDTARRAAIIRQHHPLVARAHRSPARMRRDSRITTRRPTSSCASESVKSSRKSLVRSGSSRNYWDLGGSIGSGSLLASGGMMGV